MRRITNLFQHTKVSVAFRSNNTIAQLTKPPNGHKVTPRNKWWIYQLTCNSCNLSYVGQITCSLKVRYKKHIRYIRYNKPQSAYAQYIICSQHEYGTMNNVMTLLKPLNNPNKLTPYEKFHIQTLHKKGKLIPEQYADDPNPLFQLAIHPPYTTWQGQSCSIPLPVLTAGCSAPDPWQPVTKEWTVYNIHLNNITKNHEQPTNTDTSHLPHNWHALPAL